MTETQIATIITAVSAAGQAISHLVALLEDEELTEDQKAKIRTAHKHVQEATEALTPIPKPPAGP